MELYPTRLCTVEFVLVVLGGRKPEPLIVSSS